MIWDELLLQIFFATKSMSLRLFNAATDAIIRVQVTILDFYVRKFIPLKNGTAHEYPPTSGCIFAR